MRRTIYNRHSDKWSDSSTRLQPSQAGNQHRSRSDPALSDPLTPRRIKDGRQPFRQIRLFRWGIVITKPATLTFTEVEEIRRLPETWLALDLRRVLDVLDVDGYESYADAILEEMALMALQDCGVEEATHVILSNSTEDRFSKGQIRNLCNELKEDRCWEEYADIAHQKSLYTCVDLLSAAFPFDYAEPDATRVSLTIACSGLDKVLGGDAIDAATLLRGVGLCQEKSSILNRFFSSQIAGAHFPEASMILWHVKQAPAGPDTIQITFWGSSYWFEDIEEGLVSTITLKWPEE